MAGALKKQLTEMDAKLKALQLRIKRSDEVIEKGERSAVDRQRESIDTIVSTINLLKGSIEEAKFGQGEPDEDVLSWSEGIDNAIFEADQHVKRLGNFVKEIDSKENEIERAKMHDQNMMYERELLEQKLKATLKAKEVEEKSVKLHLPKK